MDCWRQQTNTDIVLAKLLFNSTISTPEARFMSVDISDFYLNTPMKEFEYMWVQRHMLPPEVIAAYNLEAKFVNDKVLCEIQQGMYGLPQAGRIAY